MTNSNSTTVPVVSIEIPESLYFVMLDFAEGEDIGKYIHRLFTVGE